MALIVDQCIQWVQEESTDTLELCRRGDAVELVSKIVEYRDEEALGLATCGSGTNDDGAARSLSKQMPSTELVEERALRPWESISLEFHRRCIERFDKTSMKKIKFFERCCCGFPLE